MKLPINEWTKCYESGWKDIIVPEAFSHPAKMSYGLLKRILAHVEVQGWLNKGDVIVDPFGGIGSTGILGAYEGYQVVCVELEAKFCKLAEQNFELHKDAWVEFGNPYPMIIQGDSRRLCEVVEKASVIISSPPYERSLDDGHSSNKRTDGTTFTYSMNPANLGAMPKGKLADCIVSSPPYAESSIEQTHMTSNKRGDESDPGYRPSWKKKLKDGYADTKRPYGQTPGQLGSMKPGNVDMVVSSPPYAEAISKRKGPSGLMGGTFRLGKSDMQANKEGYSQNPENLGNLKSGDVDCVISSPPYEKAHAPNTSDSDILNTDRKDLRKWAWNQTQQGETTGQLSNDKGDTFWQAAKTIVEQCFQILKPGGHAIWVVKSFVRNKKIMDFPGDWQRLCESVGFKTVCIHHAMLVKETTHQTLFGDTEVKRTERKSFFRRLAESKGSPRIDYEVVLCMSKNK